MNLTCVTGGAGFIGSHLVERLLAEGNEVIVYDNLSTGSLENIEQHLNNSAFHFVQGDLLDRTLLAASLEGCSAVFHLAAHADVREGINNTRIDLENETIATHILLETMREAGIGKLVFASSATVYGETPAVPLSESYGPTCPSRYTAPASWPARG
jgi:UDP-glucose 4-epimerase